MINGHILTFAYVAQNCVNDINIHSSHITHVDCRQMANERFLFEFVCPNTRCIVEFHRPPRGLDHKCCVHSKPPRSFTNRTLSHAYIYAMYAHNAKIVICITRRRCTQGSHQALSDCAVSSVRPNRPSSFTYFVCSALC